MTQDEIIAMAREAGFVAGKLETPHGERALMKHSGFDCLAEIVRFAALVAAKEREACAWVCEQAIALIWDCAPKDVQQTGRNVCTNLAKAIRAGVGASSPDSAEFALAALVAAGHVSQSKVDEARELMPEGGYQAQAVPQGWQLVPVEPTKEIMEAAVRFANGDAVYKNVAAAALKIEEEIYGETYAAMLAAAPKP